MHGGKVPVGLANPLTTNGNRSRYIGVLSDNAASIFNNRLKDFDQLSLRPDITLLDMRVELLMKRVENAADDPQWNDALRLFEEFASAQVDKDRDRALTALQKLADVLRKGQKAETTWGEIERLAWQRRPAMVEKEVKMGVTLVETVQRGVVINLLRILAESVKRHVTDQQTLNSINGDIVRLASAALAGLGTGAVELSPARSGTADN